ncbi:DUF6807 family protein [Arthrobacter citreus]|uniref:DUF6807 family protein n=1 Tax=Arthrobacter citreus TaxID=1670 RepID=A0ABZ2ZVH7_9MICC
MTPHPEQHPSPAPVTSRSSRNSGSPGALPRIALVGIHGFGARHLQRLRHLEASGVLTLAAVADPRPPEPGELDPSVAVFDTAQELLSAGTAPDVVIIATPIHTHADLAVAALEAGADVYLEKPAAASMEQYHRILAVSERTGRAVQVGFQSLGSKALDVLAGTIGRGELGTVRGISATGLWVRDRDYFNRSRWAGKRILDGVDVVDGVITNPLAHAVATALRIGGARGTSDVDSVEVDAYRAHDIEGDDTSVVRLRTGAGTTIMCALTVCAPEQKEPLVTVHGTQGQAVLSYTTDELELTTAAGTSRSTHARTDLLENLLDHRRNGTPLLSSLADSGAFMTVLEAVRSAGPVHPISDSHVTWVGSGGAAHPVIHGIEDIILRAVRSQSTFSELLVPWARPVAPAESFVLAGSTVAELRSGDGIRADASPRPYLHPVTTLSGVQVTDHLPSDHVWHLGAGVTLQDVNGVNFWGGRTYRREAAGYVWRDDHGHIRDRETDASPNALAQALEWCGPDGSVLLTEQRNWHFTELDGDSWLLDLNFTLTAASDPVLLGSPGSNGRDGGGYGGFFWRLPACTDVRVRTADAEGEDAVHGSIAPWLAWTAQFPDGPATLVFVPDPQEDDPWFVRCSGYPGVGLSLAWDTPVRTSSSAPISRSVSVVVVDGRVDDDGVARLVADLQAQGAVR